MGFNYLYTSLVFCLLSFSIQAQHILEPQIIPTGNNHTKTLQAQRLWSGQSLGLSLSGNGQTVYQWEAPLSGNSHPDSTNSYLINRVSSGDAVSGFSTHATEMAQIMIGQGADSSLHGIAYSSTIKAYSLTNFWTDFSAEAANMKLSLHAYASNYGWSYNSAVFGRFWWGLEEIDSTEDYHFGFYDDDTKMWDSLIYKNPYFLPVKSVGNDRGETFSGKHYFYKSIGGSTVNYSIDSSSTVRLDDGGINGYDCIPPVSVAKNVLTVSAVDFIVGGWQSASDVSIRAGSAYGPVDDGRIKPDLVTGGEKTSQSGASAAGVLLLLREHFINVKSEEPLASTMKALLIHTADEAGSFDGPDYKFGWGLMNAKSAAEHISNSDSSFLLFEDTLTNGNISSYHVYINGANSIKATLCWTDPEGTPLTFQNNSSMLDNAQVMLVNDLDLRIEKRKNSCIMKPYVLDPQNPDSAAKKIDNSIDNVEVVEWKLPEKGWYTLTVGHKNTLTNTNQTYSLLITGVKTGLVYDGTNWIPNAPTINTGNLDVLIMKNTEVSLPNDFKANDITIERKAKLKLY